MMTRAFRGLLDDGPGLLGDEDPFTEATAGAELARSDRAAVATLLDPPRTTPAPSQPAALPRAAATPPHAPAATGPRDSDGTSTGWLALLGGGALALVLLRRKRR